jgi:hypothetical protein
LALMAGGGTGQEAIAQPEKLGFAETKVIAEAGFLHGLLIVMNYAVLYVIDRNSGRALFNEISDEHRVFTDQDTAIVTLDSDTLYLLV